MNTEEGPAHAAVAKKQRPWLNLAIVCALVAAMLVYLALNFNLRDIGSVLLSVPWYWNVLSLLSLAGQFALEAICFYVLLRLFGDRIRYTRALKYSAVDLFYMNISPFALCGIPAQAYYMTKDGIQATHTAMSITIFTCLNKLAMCISGIFALICVPSLLTVDNPFFGFTLIYGLIVMVGIILFCGFSMFSPGFIFGICAFFIKLGAKLRIVKNKEKTLASFRSQMAEYSACSGYIKHNFPKSVFVFILCITKRILMLAPVIFIYRGLNLSGTSLAYLLAIQAVLGMSLESFVIPGAIGAYETASMALYPQLFGEANALPAVLYFRVFTYLLLVISSGAVVALSNFLSGLKSRSPKHP